MLHNDFDFQELAKGLQTEAQTWERLLYSTGGQLTLSKCLYYLMIFDFKPDGTPTLRKASKMGNDLIILTTGRSATTTTIEHRECSQAHKTLELHLTPNGDHDAQAKELKLKSEYFAAGMSKAPLSHYEARSTAYWMMWLPSMQYCLPCSHMTRCQLHNVQKKMISTSLSKMGYSSKMHRAVVFGPRRYLGIGLHHLKPDQGIGQTLQLLKHVHSNSKLGAFLQIVLDWTQLYAGISSPILECTRITLPHLEMGWYTSMREFLGSIDASLHIPTMVTPQALRISSDCVLMDNLFCNDFTSGEVKKLNLCCLFLQHRIIGTIHCPVQPMVGAAIHRYMDVWLVGCSSLVK
jgi:hypothetical protein